MSAMTGPGAERQAAAEAAALALERASASMERAATLAGLDGFVDTIIRPVRRRPPERPDAFEAIGTMSDFAARVAEASGRSCNIELVVEQVRAGGNGVNTAEALLALGAPVTYIGNLGEAEGDCSASAGATKLHPVYAPFAGRCRALHSLGPTSRTDALEFTDGKLMLGRLDGLSYVRWDSVLARVGGVDAMVLMLGGVRLLVLANWRAIRGMTRIWRGLTEEALPRVPARDRPRVFIDLADPSARTDEEIADALDALAAMNLVTPVTLGLNTAETARIAQATCVGARLAPGEPAPERLRDAAAAIRAAVRLSCVVSHGRSGAGGATARESDCFVGPFTARPVLSTGAGDRFNAGFGLAQTLGAPLAPCLAAGCALAGWCVRNGAPPTMAQLVAFLRALPAPDRAD